MIDTHSHLYLEEFGEDLNSVINRSQFAGINKIILPNVDNSTTDNLFKVADLYKDYCLPAAGLHPVSVKENFEAELLQLKNILETAQRKIWAIGETGIDLYWDKTYFEQQKQSLIFQADLAVKFGIPIIIHSRNSLNEIIELFRNYKNISQLKGVFHCFPGDVNQAHLITEMGFMLGIGGVITYKNSSMQDVVRNIDLKYILLETDAPYLTPAPFRGKRNEPAYLNYIVDKIAELKSTSSAIVKEFTTQNAIALFNINI